MSHDILAAKLHELESQVLRMQRCIRDSESAGPDELRAEACALREECAESELVLREQTQNSRAGIAARLAGAYEQAEGEMKKVMDAVRAETAEAKDAESRVEAQLLAAEYALDFSMLSVDRALLVSLEAIAAQLALQKGESEQP